MGKLTFIVGEKKQDWNFEIRVKIEPINTQADYSDAQHREQQRFDFPETIKVEKVDWGDGTIDADTKHSYQPGEYTVKAIVTSMTDDLDLSFNNITELVKIPGFIGDSPAVGPKFRKFVFDNNKFLPGATIPVLNKILEMYPDNVNELDSMVNKAHFVSFNGQVGYLTKTRGTGKVAGKSANAQISLPTETLLAYRRTQEEIDKAWELVDKGWRVEMAVDDVYTIRLPKSVDDYLVDGHLGNDGHGVRTVSVLPFYDASSKTVVGRVMKLMPHQYGMYPRDERSSTADGYENRGSTLVPQKIYGVWQYRLPDAENWVNHSVVKVKPVPQEGDTLTRIPAGKYVGTYKLTEPIDVSKFPSGTKIRFRQFYKWGIDIIPVEDSTTNDVFRGIHMSRLRIVDGNGLYDNMNLVLTLP